MVCARRGCDVFSWRRSTDFDHVGDETRAVRNSVGLGDISGFAKYRVTGSGAADWLDRILACKMPPVGRMVLAPMLNHDGKIIGDFSLARLADDDFLIIGSGIAESYHMRWFLTHASGVDNLHIDPLGLSLVGLTLAGPKSREVLQSCTNTDISHENMRFMAIKKMEIGMLPAIVGRISYTGDLGYEIWVAPGYLNRLFDHLMTAGAAHNIRLFGSRALNALRLEKIMDHGRANIGLFMAQLKPGLMRLLLRQASRFCWQGWCFERA